METLKSILCIVAVVAALLFCNSSLSACDGVALSAANGVIVEAIPDAGRAQPVSVAKAPVRSLAAKSLQSDFRNEQQQVRRVRGRKIMGGAGGFSGGGIGFRPAPETRAINNAILTLRPPTVTRLNPPVRPSEVQRPVRAANRLSQHTEQQPGSVVNPGSVVIELVPIQ